MTDGGGRLQAMQGVRGRQEKSCGAASGVAKRKNGERFQWSGQDIAIWTESTLLPYRTNAWIALPALQSSPMSSFQISGWAVM